MANVMQQVPVRVRRFRETLTVRYLQMSQHMLVKQTLYLVTRNQNWLKPGRSCSVLRSILTVPESVTSKCLPLMMIVMAIVVVKVITLLSKRMIMKTGCLVKKTNQKQVRMKLYSLRKLLLASILGMT